MTYTLIPRARRSQTLRAPVVARNATQVRRATIGEASTRRSASRRRRFVERLGAFFFIAFIETHQLLLERIVALQRNHLRFQTTVTRKHRQFDFPVDLHRVFEKFSVGRDFIFVYACKLAVLQTHERTVCMNLHDGSVPFFRLVQWTVGEGRGSTITMCSFGASIRSRS